MSSVISKDLLYSSLPRNDALHKQDTRLKSVSKKDPNQFHKISTEADSKWEHRKRYIVITQGHRMLTVSPI